jgi:hypothetical protein
MKIVANEIFGVFERFNRGECTRDKALEDASKIIDKYVNERPIVGYVKSGTLKKVLVELINNKKRNPEKTYIFDCQIHQNEMSDIERIYDSMNN